MKAFLAVVLLFAGLVLTARAQQQADEKYIGIYGVIQQAEQLAQTGDPGEALAAYTDAEKALRQFQNMYPTWNPNIVKFRLNQITDKITTLKRQAPAQPAPAAPTAMPATAAPAAAPAPSLTSSELDNLRTELQSAQAVNEALQAKLKEALSVQPAAVDPRELTRAQEKIRELMKQIDLLKASAPGPETAAVVTRTITNHINVSVTNTFPGVAQATRPTVITNFVRVLVADTNALEIARLDQAAAVKNFNDEHVRAERLADELQKLRQQSGAQTNRGAADTLRALRAENAALKDQIATLRSGSAPAAAAANPAGELAQARARIETLQTAVEVAGLEKQALERKLKQLLAATNSTTSPAAGDARIRELTQERNDLIERLDLANQQKAGGKNAELAGQLTALKAEVATLRSRLAVAEASPVPYTAEELALSQASAPKPASSDAGSKPIRAMPADTAALVASAQNHFVRQEFDQAEADYQKILERDQNNGIALANLATIEMQQGKLDKAEQHINAALAQSPNDAYNLCTLGYLKLRQGKYPESLNALSRAAQLDPNNPEIQNYLGIALGHEGQRKPAETALRRALQINPAYAPAHNNLAVMYLGQTPPLAELARWHYQKALDAGQPRNSDLEKLLADKGAPVNPQ